VFAGSPALDPTAWLKMKILRKMKGVAFVRAIRRGRLEMIHELTIHQQINVGGIPFHRPNVEGIGPGVAAQTGNGLGLG